MNWVDLHDSTNVTTHGLGLDRAKMAKSSFNGLQKRKLSTAFKRYPIAQSKPTSAVPRYVSKVPFPFFLFCDVHFLLCITMFDKLSNAMQFK
jgi:hypothetical protein